MATKAVVNTSTLNAIAAAINAKAGTTGTMTPSEMAAKISAIPSGGSGSWPWSKPDNWPDIREILEADTYDYANKAICLRSAKFARLTNYSSTIEAYRFSDDPSNLSTEQAHTFDRSKDIVIGGERFVWIIVYSDSALDRAFYSQGGTSGTVNPDVLWVYGPDAEVSLSLDFPFLGCPNLQSVTFKTITQTAGYKRLFGDCNSLVEVNADTITVADATQCFENCYSLKKVNAEIDTSGCTVFDSMWRDARSIASIPDFDISNATSMEQIFRGCYALRSYPPNMTFPSGNATMAFYFNFAARSLPDYTDFRNVTSFTSTFNNLIPEMVPETLLCSTDINLNSVNYNVFYKDRFAKFENGEITGGLVYNLNNISEAHTFTIGPTMKGLFSADERTKIATMFTDKGWTLAW